MPPERIFDKASFLDRMMGDEELAKEIVEAFLEDLPKQVHKLEDALRQNDADTVSRQAHTLKGAAGNIGAVAMMELAHRMESAGKRGEIQEAQVLMGQLDEHLPLFKKSLLDAGLA